MHYTGDLVNAQTLQPYGGIAEIVPEARLLESALALAHSIARHSPATLRLAKRSLNGIEYMDLKQGYEFEQSLTLELSGYHDSKEAVNAFLEKRPPVYTGR
jgi:enoyl-CoA hydratase